MERKSRRSQKIEQIVEVEEILRSETCETTDPLTCKLARFGQSCSRLADRMSSSAKACCHHLEPGSTA